MATTKLILGDCLEHLKEIPDNSIDCIITDPPYALNKEMQNDTKEEIVPLLKGFFKEAKRIIKDKHPMLVFFDSGKNLPLCFQAAEGEVSFEKMCFMYKPADCSFPHGGVLRKSEALLIFSKSGILSYCGDGSYIHDVIKGIKLGKEKINGSKFFHPSVKSLVVVDKCLLSHTKEGELVLDPFMGSGTMGLSCKKHNRNFIGIEIDEKYFKLAEKRIGEWQGQERLI